MISGIALVTGAEGFVGSHLAEKLLELGLTVRTLVYKSDEGKKSNLQNARDKYPGKIQIFRGNITQKDTLGPALDGVDYVFHCAAQTGFKEIMENPSRTVDVNANGTLNMLLSALDAHKKKSLKRFLFLSSANVYGGAKYIPIDEKHPITAKELYAASKIAAEKYCEGFFNAYGLPVTIIRPFNMYGPRQLPKALIPAVITQALINDTVKLGTMTTTRDFLFVGDAVDAIIAAASSENTLGEMMNMGSGVETSIGDTVGKIKTEIEKRSGRTITLESEEDKTRSGTVDINRLCTSIDKIKNLTGWAPAHTLDEGIAKTIDWYEKENK